MNSADIQGFVGTEGNFEFSDGKEFYHLVDKCTELVHKQKEIDINRACEALYILANEYGCDLKNIEVAKNVMKTFMEGEE